MTMVATQSARPRRASRGALLLALAVASPWACSDATDVELLEISGFGALFGVAYLDMDGSESLTLGDEPISDASVVLTSSAAAGVVDTATTDSLGLFRLFEVPVGSYILGLDSTALGDSLQSLSDGTPIVVAVGDTTRIDIGTTYPLLSLEEALAAAVGTRVFTGGIALNARINFGDGQVHFAGDSAFLRALNVDRSGVNRGDSVRVLGRVVMDNGRPALDEVTSQVLVPGAVLVLPQEATTAEANSADGGRLDAALVRISAAEFSDTSTTADGHFRFWADDGSDSVEVWGRDFVGLDHGVFRTDTILRINEVVGLLSPYDDGGGVVRWRLMPRTVADVTLEQKAADIGVEITLDTAQASLGDTVEVTVVALNNGPLTATSVQVQDTIPTALTFLSAAQTSGVYNPGSGLWSVGSLASGGADTLMIRMEVIDGTPTTVPNIAESLGLLLEVDIDADNDLVFVVLTIS